MKIWSIRRPAAAPHRVARRFWAVVIGVHTVLACGDRAATPVQPAVPAVNVPADIGTAGHAQGVAAAPESRPASGPVGDTEPASLTLLLSNEQLGELEPCGCAEGQYGGLPRRASLLQVWRAQGRTVVQADNGDLIAEAGLQSQQKLETTLSAHQVMGTLAINLGELDLQLDPQTVQLTALTFGVPYVSANVKPADATHIVRSVETSGGVIRLGLTGFLDPQLVGRVEPGWQVQNPRQALEPVLEELARTADVVIVLAHATAARTAEILDGLSQPDALIVAHEAEDPIEPVPSVLRGIPALSPGTQAKYLGRLDITLDGSRKQLVAGYEGLHERIPDLPSVRALLEGYQAILQQLNIVDLTPRKPYASGGEYVGPDTCKACHPGAFDAWTESRHGHALATLVERNREFDPDCLQCHVTGFPFETGYQSRDRTPQLAFVSCESCHGPGSNHAADPTPPEAGAGYGQTDTPTLCMTCHDEPNSPHFAFEAYWPKIAHGLDWERVAEEP